MKKIAPGDCSVRCNFFTLYYIFLEFWNITGTSRLANNNWHFLFFFSSEKYLIKNQVLKCRKAIIFDQITSEVAPCIRPARRRFPLIDSVNGVYLKLRSDDLFLLKRRLLCNSIQKEFLAFTNSKAARLCQSELQFFCALSLCMVGCLLKSSNLSWKKNLLKRAPPLCVLQYKIFWSKGPLIISSIRKCILHFPISIFVNF